MADDPDDPDVFRASRRPGGAVHRGIVWLLRHEPRWLVDLLVRRKFLPPGRFIEQLPTEIWPVGEENRFRELRADLVLRLWDSPPPENPSLAVIRECDVLGVIADFQNQQDLEKGLRLIEYDSAYPPVLGRHICLVVMTFEEKVAQWVRELLSRRRLTMRHFVLTPRWIPRSGLIDPSQAPRRALLEAMVHGRNPRSLALLTNALRALRQFSGTELVIYEEMLLSRMQEALIMKAQRQLEAEEDDPRWLDYKPTRVERESFLYVRGERAGLERGREEGREEGREGRAHMLLEILRARGFEPDAAMEARILACRDPDRLREWVIRAATITHLDKLFD